LDSLTISLFDGNNDVHSTVTAEIEFRIQDGIKEVNSFLTFLNFVSIFKTVIEEY